MAKIAFFHRRRWPNANYSIERIFENLRADLKDRIDSAVVVVPHHSKGLWPRVANVLHARRHQSDVNHVTGDVNFLAIGLSRKKTILTHHDASFLLRTTGIKHAVLKLFWLRLPVWRSKFVTTVSEATRQDLLNRVRCSPEKVVVIHNAISDDFGWVPKPTMESMPRILQIGTAPNKNIVRLAESLKGLHCQLTIVGRLDDTQQEVLRKNGIRYENLVDLTDQEIRDQYVRADIVAFVSTVEGFGMPIVEAQATGRPVVTSNCSSMPEVAGDGALLVDPLNIASIRSGFERLLGDASLRAAIIEAGRKNAMRFNRQQIASQYFQLYQAIIQENTSN